MRVRFIASKVTAVAASAALFGGATAWIAAAAGGPDANTGGAAAQPGTTRQRVYVVERTAPDGSTYLETVPAPRAVTRTGAS